MKKISETHAIILDESGPTGRHEVVGITIKQSMNVKIIEMKIGERCDTLNGQIAFLRALLHELIEYRDSNS